LGVVLALLLGGVAGAQYGYPYGYPYGYDATGYMYGWPMGYDATGYMYGWPMGYGNGMAGQVDPLQQEMYMTDQYMNALQQQLNAEMQRIEQEMAQFDAAANAKMAEIYQYFISLYRTTTGDATSSNEVALYYGQQIHCQQHALDCQLAAQQANESAAALAASNAAFQARMASQQAGFDAQNAQWAADQEARSQANSEWIDTVIRGQDDYSAGGGGPTYQLPFAPSQGQAYQTPLGNPLVFDQSQNIWYQIGPDGSFTPYYQVP